MQYAIKKLEKEAWPPLLKQINDPPKQLYFAGRIPDYSQKFLCIVGSRKYTNYGREVVNSIISELRGFPITIVSGLALGIDAIAHRSAIQNNLTAIAVPGSGLDPEAMHPKTNVQLAKEIIDSGGTLLSEYEPSFKATLWSFPLRNRIMAGMCHATLIVEAEQKSGTMITAKLTTEYNRELLAIPGNITSPMSEGPNMFIRLGATLIRSADDVLEALGIGRLNYESIPLRSEEQSFAGLKKYQDCSEKEILILNLLKEPLEKDVLIRKVAKNNISVAEIQTLLTLLELKGHIEEKMGEMRLK
ncbi:MAG: DNA-processing protein DprA [Patescibacteria group bacterium]